MNKIQIFVADDVEMMIKGVQGFTANEPDLEVSGTASNGEELLQLLARRPGEADLLLVDVNMPKLDGLKAIAKIREANAQIKILVMTIFPSRDFMADALHVGANGFIAKSRSQEEFVRTIRRVYAGETIVLPDVGDSPLPSSPKPLPDLTPIEKRVICLIIQGKRNAEIVEVLHLTIHNVNRIRRNAFFKLGANSPGEAVRIALERGIRCDDLKA
jgi:two-component system, NarL family, response regulator NreC